MVGIRTGAKSYAGRTMVTGNSTLSFYDGAATPINSVVQVDAGSTLVLEGLGNGTIAGLEGAGTVKNNDNWANSSLLNVGGIAAIVHTFTGPIVGGMRLNKGSAMIRRSWGAQNNEALALIVAKGRIRLLGDIRTGVWPIPTDNPGVQLFDLAGHTVTFAIGGLWRNQFEEQFEHLGRIGGGGR